MGWSHTYGASKSEVIADITADYTGGSGASFKKLKHCVRGNTVYAVVEMTRGEKVERFIAVYLLSKSRGVGWGYKDMDEGAHPYYYNCPLAYLDMCTAPMNESSAKWREKVRAYQAIHGRKLAVGDKVKLTNGWEVEIESVKPLRCMYAGLVYKFSRKSLAAAACVAAATEAATA
jgi:hypothetical protein